MGTATGSVQAEPWAPASEVSQALGISMALFSYPGAGKTTLLGTADKVLILDLEGGAEVLADRDDVMIWPKPNDQGKIPQITFDDVISISQQLKARIRKGELPFDVIGFDTVSALYRLALQKVMVSSPTPQMPSQPEYGKANELVLELVRSWCAIAREHGLVVVFCSHAEEIKDEATNIVLIRMALTPGVIKGMFQCVSAIGYLEENTRSAQRKLLLKSNGKVLAKFRQPQSGPQLPLEIVNPSLGAILDHKRGVKAITAAPATPSTERN